MKKPELLVPVGNIETFFAAIEAGADAIYLGLKHFNARERATNFSYSQISTIINEAHKNNCKVFITLNTVIKNNELSELLDVLYFLEKIKPDAIIIQDWGVYYLLKNYFPKLVIHASTQMANHNSLGANYSLQKNFERVILARELSFDELQQIRNNTKIELEIFIHGALCYSFSGMCHFSSYLGGHGANRGYCTQPCRRVFKADNQAKYFFSLKDNQQIDLIPKLVKLGINTLKIEGRLKSDDYVYRVTKAYRMAIDKPENIEQAKKMLDFDMGREKTSYFLGKNLKNAITEHPNTGLFVGKITEINNTGFCFYSSLQFKIGYRIRVKDNKTNLQTNIKVKDFEQQNNIVCIKTNKKLSKNDQVYLSAMPEKKFPTKLSNIEKEIQVRLSEKKKNLILREIKSINEKKIFSLFVRIDSNKWLRKIYLDKIDNLIINLSQSEWKNFKTDSPFIQKNKKKIWVEFPAFIAETQIKFYKDIAKSMANKGLNQFLLSHISQKLLLPQNSVFATNENVYTYNDFAVKFLRNEGAKFTSYPVENSQINFDAYKLKTGIFPLYFYPKLFISRMPADIPENRKFLDDTNINFIKHVRNGITFVVPAEPVSFMQYTKEYKKKGFRNFLIDLSFEKPSSNRFNTILKRYFSSEQIQPSTNFNFKRELK